jgi:hypothetical protein
MKTIKSRVRTKTEREKGTPYFKPERRIKYYYSFNNLLKRNQHWKSRGYNIQPSLDQKKKELKRTTRRNSI